MTAPFPFRWFLTLCFCGLALSVAAELRVPAFTAYLEPERGAGVSSENGIVDWRSPETKVLWFGECQVAGTLQATVSVRLAEGEKTLLRLSVDGKVQEKEVTGGNGPTLVSFGEFIVAKPGYVRFELTAPQENRPVLGVDALLLDGPAVEGAHFNLVPRRNAASVHLSYETPDNTNIALFYNEITGVEEPVYTFYMANGFSRGYFGMQINSPTERRILFSVWDSGSGGDARDRSTVEEENHVQLLAKGEGVTAKVFGNEGTGGQSYIVYPWKTGSVQKFVLTAKPEGTSTDYTGWWFHPEDEKWMLMARFRAPKDGKYLRGLHSFSENFGGGNGHLQRKVLFGPAWVQTDKGDWHEITRASFSHDGTGKADRLDRFMGVENGRFFLSHGGFVPGFTKYGDPFDRPATSGPPQIALPELP